MLPSVSLNPSLRRVLAYNTSKWTDQEYLAKLPDDLIIELGLRTDLPTLANLCQTNKRISSLLCYNQEFWKDRYIREFGPTFEEIHDWKKEYNLTVEFFPSVEELTKMYRMVFRGYPKVSREAMFLALNLKNMECETVGIRPKIFFNRETLTNLTKLSIGGEKLSREELAEILSKKARSDYKLDLITRGIFLDGNWRDLSYHDLRRIAIAFGVDSYLPVREIIRGIIKKQAQAAEELREAGLPFN